MNQVRKKKITALLRREIQEYKNSFVTTPLVVAGVLILCMLASVLLANRITVAGDSIMDILHDENSHAGMNITISIDDKEISHDYVVSEESGDDAAGTEDWNFSSEWKFNPQRSEKMPEDAGAEEKSLNPILNGLHCLFLLLLLATSINYLLGTFHQDRRDRSVLFWKSVPVSEPQEVAAKIATVCLVAPAIYLAVSVVTQLAAVLLAMLMTWRMDMGPMETVLGNIDFLGLFRGQIVSLLIWVLWTVPFYAWLLLCSAAARRSPLLFALAIPITFIVLEQLFIGSEHLSNAFSNHIPHPGNDGQDPLGFYFYEPQWWSLDYLGMLLGLLVAAALLTGTIWFRKHRFEI
ncbi:MAG: hypothetical protein V7700_11020 [Halioglobus sp.]